MSFFIRINATHKYHNVVVVNVSTETGKNKNGEVAEFNQRQDQGQKQGVFRSRGSKNGDFLKNFFKKLKDGERSV